MENKQQLAEAKELLQDLLEYANNDAALSEFPLICITQVLLETTIEELERNKGWIIDDEDYRAMFSSVYTLIHDERALKYRRDKKYYSA